MYRLYGLDMLSEGSLVMFSWWHQATKRGDQEGRNAIFREGGIIRYVFWNFLVFQVMVGVQIGRAHV